MIKTDKLIKILVVVLLGLMYNPSASFAEEPDADTDTYHYQAKRRTKSAEQIRAEEEEEDKKEEENIDDVNYDNTYNKLPLLPEAMVLRCKMNAQDIAEDLSLLDECFKIIKRAENNANAAIKMQAIHDFDVINNQALTDSLANASLKLISSSNYEDAQNNYVNSTFMSGTQRETEVALGNTQGFQNDLLNNYRGILAEELKRRAIEGIMNIDPSAILNEDEYNESKHATP